MNTISVEHNFEAAHRLPHLGGKCQSLHGHSWWADVTLAGPVDHSGVIVEFGQVKALLRDWIDTYLDHGAMLGAGDPLVPALHMERSKVFRFGAQGDPDAPEALAYDLHWPTVENVAVLIGRLARVVIDQLDVPSHVSVAGVRICETHVNAAEWRP